MRRVPHFFLHPIAREIKTLRLFSKTAKINGAGNKAERKMTKAERRGIVAKRRMDVEKIQKQRSSNGRLSATEETYRSLRLLNKQRLHSKFPNARERMVRKLEQYVYSQELNKPEKRLVVRLIADSLKDPVLHVRGTAAGALNKIAKTNKDLRNPIKKILKNARKNERYKMGFILIDYLLGKIG